MMKWNLREIVVLSILSVVFAVIYLLFFKVGIVLTNVLTPLGFGPFGYEIIFGIWFIVSIIAAYIIRKPGAAFISETVAATIEVLIGNFTGPMLIISGMIQGLGAETAFAMTKWKNYSTWVLVLSGMMAAVFSFVWGYFISGFSQLAWWMVIAMFIVRLMSGAALAGLLGKWVSDALAKTGVLRGFALGKEARKKREQHAS